MSITSYLNGNKIESEPTLLFDKFDSSAVNKQVYWGLRTFGPYDKNKSKLKVSIIAPHDRFDKTAKIITDLQSGTIQILPGGMKSFFRCELELTDQIKIPNISLESYKTATKELIDSSKPSESDVVLVNVPKTSPFVFNSPYYIVKGMLASHGFVSQMVTDGTFDNLKWSYLNLASAIFSKSGAIPWVLSGPITNVDMILGISRSAIIPSQSVTRQVRRFIGHVNLFDNHGRWMAHESTAEPYDIHDKYADVQKLGELVQKSLEKFKAVKKKDLKNLVIHNSKRFGRQDRNMVVDTLKKNVSDFNVAFVTIDETHPFRLYDKKTADGSFPRGYYAYLNEDECLLSTTGESNLGGRRMGTPRLLHISVQQSNGRFISLDEINNHIMGLTKLDWATSMPYVREPVTILFANEVARLTGTLSYNDWQSINTPSVNSILSNRPWFL